MNFNFNKKNIIIFAGILTLIVIVCTGAFTTVLLNQNHSKADNSSGKIMYDQLEALYKNQSYIDAKKVLEEMNLKYTNTELVKKANATFKDLDELARKEELEKPEKEAKAKQAAEEQTQRIIKQEEAKKRQQEAAIKERESKIYIGDNKEKVLRLFGKPQRINRTVTTNIVHEQWIYGNTYLYLENDKVTSWQESD